MDFNPFIRDPHFNPSKHIRPRKYSKKPWELLEEGKHYEIEIEGEGKNVYEVRGFWHNDRSGDSFLILWPKGASKANDYLVDEILSVKEISNDAAKVEE